MIGYLLANGKSSADFGVVLSDAGVYGKAERDLEFISVPGRTGDLLIDNQRYKNVTYTYQCVIYRDFDVNFTAFIGYLLSQDGYIRIEDSFHPDEYVLAQYTGQTDPSRVLRDRIGRFDLQFNRKPQRWLKDGEKAVTFTSDGAIRNYEYMSAKPLVRVYGTSGDVIIGDNTITFTGIDTYLDVDCDLQDAYKGSTNCNSKISLGSGKFWEIAPGLNQVDLGSGITKVEITPRWWRL